MTKQLDIRELNCQMLETFKGGVFPISILSSDKKIIDEIKKIFNFSKHHVGDEKDSDGDKEYAVGFTDGYYTTPSSEKVTIEELTIYRNRIWVKIIGSTEICNAIIVKLKSKLSKNKAMGDCIKSLTMEYTYSTKLRVKLSFPIIYLLSKPQIKIIDKLNSLLADDDHIIQNHPYAIQVRFVQFINPIKIGKKYPVEEMSNRKNIDFSISYHDAEDEKNNIYLIQGHIASEKIIEALKSI